MYTPILTYVFIPSPFYCLCIPCGFGCLTYFGIFQSRMLSTKFNKDYDITSAFQSLINILLLSQTFRFLLPYTNVSTPMSMSFEKTKFTFHLFSAWNVKET